MSQLEQLSAADPAGERLECPRCGYDMRGRAVGRCPECGTEHRLDELRGPHLPWARRRAIGRTRAFLQTVRMVTLRNRAFCGLLDKSIDYSDAQRFRAVIILLLYVPLLLASLGFVAAGAGDRLNFLKFESVTGAIATQVVLHVCVLLFLLAVTGVPSYFFHPAHLPIERQNRAVALSYYTSAPLVLVPIAYLLIAVAAHFGEVLGWAVPATILAIAGSLCALVAPIAWAVYLRKLGNATMGPRRAWKTTMVVIPLWILVTVATLGLLPLAVYYVALVVHSGAT